jgi:putative ABC transport system substrate-binding protein
VKRREFITLLGGAAAWPLAAYAQQATKVYHVAYLALITASDSIVVKQRLHELGYGEGKDLVFDYRTAEGRSERLPQLALESVRTNPDVLVAGSGALTAKALQSATATIPIVFTSVGDPIGAGIVKSLNRPGANITGVTAQSSELVRKRLQVLLELLPGIRVVAVLMNPDTPFTALALQELRIAAAARG